jgi:hypothetical protein
VISESSFICIVPVRRVDSTTSPHKLPSLLPDGKDKFHSLAGKPEEMESNLDSFQVLTGYCQSEGRVTEQGIAACPSRQLAVS